MWYESILIFKVKFRQSCPSESLQDKIKIASRSVWSVWEVEVWCYFCLLLRKLGAKWVQVVGCRRKTFVSLRLTAVPYIIQLSDCPCRRLSGKAQDKCGILS